MLGRIQRLLASTHGYSGRYIGVRSRNSPVVVVRSKSEKVVKKAEDGEPVTKKVEACGPDMDEEEDEMEEMFIQGPAGMEWGGPTRGGRRPEPTRFGDWERKGRVSDF